jgi:hypothetical protein
MGQLAIHEITATIISTAQTIPILFPRLMLSLAHVRTVPDFFFNYLCLQIAAIIDAYLSF